MIHLPAILDNIRLRKDKTVSIVFASQELTDKDLLRLIQYRDQFGWIVFKPDEQVKEEDIPKEQSGYEKGKSPFQRLYGVMFKLWKEQLAEKYPDFETWRRMQVEKLIDAYKDRL